MTTQTLAANTAAKSAAATNAAATIRAVQSGASKKIDMPAAVVAGLSAADARNFAAQLGLWYVIGASGVASPVTGTASETSLAGITIPAGAMGANGILKVTALWTYTNSANAKTLRVRFGNGLSGTAFQTLAASNSTAAIRTLITIQNRNSASSQVGGMASGTFTATSVANATGTIDTTAQQTLTISGQLANTGETITLESYIVELLHQA
jgi:hypothetical protein